MNSIRQTISVLLVVVLVGLGLTTAQAQRRAYRMTDQQVEQLIRNVETRADRFRASLNLALDRSRIDGTNTEDDINRYVRDFETATDTLRTRFNSRRSVASDVENVLARAADIDRFMNGTPLTRRAQNDWSLLRTDLNVLANAYGITGRWDAGVSLPTTGGISQRPYRITDREVERIIQRLETNTDRFQSSLGTTLDSSRIDNTRREDRINEFVREFEVATDQLRTRFNSRASVAADVENVLTRAQRIDNFMQRNRLGARAESDWALVRTDLDALARTYSVAWNWNNRTLPGAGGVLGNNNRYNNDGRLTGTFTLDRSRSDDARTIADRATRTLPVSERQRIYDRLVARLESPDMLAIERRGNSVTIASSRAPQTTFDADGRERAEQLPNGRTSRVTTTLSGDQLVVSSTGFRENDFSVTFAPSSDGQTLMVTRRIFSERLTQPVVVQNTYNRTSDVAQWNVYNGTTTSSYPNSTGSVGTTSGSYVIRDGELLVAALNTNLSTRETRDGDRFSMTVREPVQFEGAVIEGTISNVSRGGRVTGRSELTFNFDTIRLRNGQTHSFSGIVEGVRTASGETVNVDNEGQVRDDNQTDRTVQRTAIGTAVGAIIGAIAGGGKGAAIGAVIGAGAGAGSVYVQGRDDLELMSGTELNIRASAPR
ncbi:MAG TPA: YMGG-like glycine zipper-containing protein [Pyrinomonadaceae bacterium]